MTIFSEHKMHAVRMTHWSTSTHGPVAAPKVRRSCGKSAAGIDPSAAPKYPRKVLRGDSYTSLSTFPYHPTINSPFVSKNGEQSSVSSHGRLEPSRADVDLGTADP